MAERRSVAGPVTGILVFLFGVVLILMTFALAYGLYQTPPTTALNVNPDKPLNLNEAASSMLRALFQVILLIVMAAIGSIIAGRGIKMYGSTPQAKDTPHPKRPAETPKTEPVE